MDTYSISASDSILYFTYILNLYSLYKEPVCVAISKPVAWQNHLELALALTTQKTNDMSTSKSTYSEQDHLYCLLAPKENVTS